jgi:hypothetical protein
MTKTDLHSPPTKAEEQEIVRLCNRYLMLHQIKPCKIIEAALNKPFQVSAIRSEALNSHLGRDDSTIS